MSKISATEWSLYSIQNWMPLLFVYIKSPYIGYCTIIYLILYWVIIFFNSGLKVLIFYINRIWKPLHVE